MGDLVSRAHIRAVLIDQAGNTIANQQVNVYQPNTTTAPIGTMYSAASAGSTVTNPRTSDVHGMIETWLEYPQLVDFVWTDSAGTHRVPGHTEPAVTGGATHFQYVAPTGNDSLDGLSPETAKKTIVAAYDTLPEFLGGHIYLFAGPVEIGKPGLWIGGALDPNESDMGEGGDGTGAYANWRKEKPLTIEGIGGRVQNLVGPGQGAQVDIVSTPASHAGPMFWASGTSKKIHFENIQFSEVYRAKHCIRLGKWSGNPDVYTNTSGITFRNCSGYVQATSDSGPVIDLGYVFWIDFKDCFFAANEYFYSGAGRDIAQKPARVILMDKCGTTDPAVPDQLVGMTAGFVTVDNCVFSASGIYYDVGSFGWQLVVRDLLVEGYGGNDLPAVVEIVGTANNASGTISLSNISSADAGTNATVLIDDGTPPDQVIISNVWGLVNGPCTIMNYKPGPITVTPAGHQQIGFWQGRVLGQHDSARRGFAPNMVRFANLVNPDSGTWANGTATIAASKLAPDGTSNAVRLASSGGTSDQNSRQAFRGNLTLQAGDWLVAGVWAKTVTAGVAMSNVLTVSLVTAGNTFIGGGTTMQVSMPAAGDGEWEWISVAAQILAQNSPCDTALTLIAAPGTAMEYYAPVFYQIDQGVHSLSEVQGFISHAQNVPYGAPAATLAPLRDHNLWLPRNYIDVVEIADPAAPAANTGRVYMRDTGGKTQLVARFPSGAVQVIATEP